MSHLQPERVLNGEEEQRSHQRPCRLGREQDAEKLRFQQGSEDGSGFRADAAPE